MSRRYVRELDSLAAICRHDSQLSHAVVQGLDLREIEIDWASVDCEEAVFLGCHFPEGVTVEFLIESGATVIPDFSGVALQSVPPAALFPRGAHGGLDAIARQ